MSMVIAARKAGAKRIVARREVVSCSEEKMGLKLIGLSSA